MADPEKDARIRKMIELARAHVESGGMNSAGAYSRIVLRETNPPRSGLQRVAHGEAAVWYARKALAERRFGAASDWYMQAVSADPYCIDYRVEMCIKAL